MTREISNCFYDHILSIMFPIGPEANASDKRCRIIARKINNRLTFSSTSLHDEIAHLYDSQGNKVMQYILQYIRFDKVYQSFVAQELCLDGKERNKILFESVSSSFQRSLARKLHRKFLDASIPEILLFTNNEEPTWRMRDLFEFEKKHYHVPPSRKLKYRLKKIKDLQDLQDFLLHFNCGETDGSEQLSLISRFDHKAFKIDDKKKTAFATFGSKRFLETGYIFVTPDIWFDKVKMKHFMESGLGILMYEPCKHYPRCDTYDSTFYKDILHFLT